MVAEDTDNARQLAGARVAQLTAIAGAPQLYAWTPAPRRTAKMQATLRKAPRQGNYVLPEQMGQSNELASASPATTAEAFLHTFARLNTAAGPN